jgi:uncharacterized protein YdaU (DUF1376 family)
MGKKPYMEFYVNDFMADTRPLSASSTGIWIKVLCDMHWKNSNGHIQATTEAICRMCGCTGEEFETFLDENKVHGIANVTDSHGIVTLVSRRMEREGKEREQARKRKARQRGRDEFTDDSENVTPALSSSSSISIKKEELKEEYTDEFQEFWETYPRRLEKRNAFAKWNARLKEGVDPEVLIAASRNYAKAKAGTDPEFIKLPATFLGSKKPYEEWITGIPEAERPDQKPQAPVDAHGNPQAEVDGKLISMKEFDTGKRTGEIVKKGGKWVRA